MNLISELGSATEFPNDLYSRARDRIAELEKENKALHKLIKQRIARNIELQTLLGKYMPQTNAEPAAWISVEMALPDYVDGEDYSENVLATDGHRLFVMSRFYDTDAEGWMWANCYGYINGDGECDDEYWNITHWMPFPKPSDAREKQ